MRKGRGSGETASVLDAQLEAAEREWRDAWKRGPTQLRWTDVPVQVGDAAPDLELEDAGGSRRRLSEFWQRAPALLLFWRHYGCGCGLIRAERLRREYPQYVRAGASVVVIGQAEPERTAAFAARYGIECPLLCDPALDAYRAYGLPEGQPSQIMYDASEELQRRDYEAGVKLAEARRADGRPLVDSPWQLPGEFVVDPGGTIRLAYRYQYCEDFPDQFVLLAAIREAARLGADG
jgi:peroxiredoxin